ncbi:hypothetical protein PanWU01x14_234360 [Parasponia andersonii]|uniref:WRKY domain containing protein n=1 Tax=Parasponia andersonii TaxID=3476 RepID=A0A2P5BIY9_PARAD|nr:hypothetical protein PanWU01x14_234360 [Parasponia andersonii]
MRFTGTQAKAQGLTRPWKHFRRWVQTGHSASRYSHLATTHLPDRPRWGWWQPTLESVPARRFSPRRDSTDSSHSRLRRHSTPPRASPSLPPTVGINTVAGNEACHYYPVEDEFIWLDIQGSDSNKHRWGKRVYECTADGCEAKKIITVKTKGEHIHDVRRSATLSS